MKKIFTKLPHVSLALVLISFSAYSTADLLGDFNQAIDLIKKIGDVLPDKNEASAVPPATPSPNNQQIEPKPVIQQDLSLILNLPQYYYERPQHFNTLGFDLGEYITVQPLDKDTFNPLYIPSYKGVPLLALTPSYRQEKADINIKNAVIHRFRNDMLIYHNLRLLALMEKHVTEQNLKVDTSNEPTFRSKSVRKIYSVQGKTRPTDRLPYVYVPRYHIQSLVTTLLPAVHNSYFCEVEPCSGNIFQRSVMQWGGYNNNNEFKSRRAYYSFVEIEVPKLQAWAKSLSSETYLVGTVGLGDYDFDRQGFELSIHAPKGISGISKQFFYAPRIKEKRIFTQGNDQGRPFFIAMSETDAENLQSQTKTTGSRFSPLYFVVKAEVYNAQNKGADRKSHGQTYVGVHLAYDVTGSVIEFYADELLTKKVFEAPINP
ncbi:MAG: hypothetical protein COB23_00085 [Methylophaga sp.]|nr:MAG: hypothetical protein COB23_00085 [Methylophaga sp.]